MAKKTTNSRPKKRTPSKKERSSTAPEQIRFHYIKSNFFRVLHVDGAYGGLTPHGTIHMAVYNDRQPIPQQVVQKVTRAGEVGEEIRDERVGREGIVREVEADLMMSANTAKAIIDWLTDKIEILEKLEQKNAVRKGRKT